MVYDSRHNHYNHQKILTIIKILGIRLASMAHSVKHALASWNESIKKFLQTMEKRYHNVILASNTHNNDINDETCNKDNDNCKSTHKDSICTSRDITFGNIRYFVYY